MGGYTLCEDSNGTVVSTTERRMRFKPVDRLVPRILSKHNRYFSRFGYSLDPGNLRKAKRQETIRWGLDLILGKKESKRLSRKTARLFSKTPTATKEQQAIHKYAIESWLTKLRRGSSMGKILPDLRRIEDGLHLAIAWDQKVTQKAFAKASKGRDISFYPFQCAVNEREFTLHCFALVSDLREQIKRAIYERFAGEIEFLISIGIKKETAEEVLSGLKIEWEKLEIIQTDYVIERWKEKHLNFFDRVRSTRFNSLKWWLTLKPGEFAIPIPLHDIPPDKVPRDFSVYLTGLVCQHVRIDTRTRRDCKRILTKNEKCLAVHTLQKLFGSSSWYREFPPIDTEFWLLLKRLQWAKQKGVDYAFIEGAQIRQRWGGGELPFHEKRFQGMLESLGFTEHYAMDHSLFSYVTPTVKYVHTQGEDSILYDPTFGYPVEKHFVRKL